MQISNDQRNTAIGAGVGVAAGAGAGLLVGTKQGNKFLKTNLHGATFKTTADEYVSSRVKEGTKKLKETVKDSGKKTALQRAHEKVEARKAFLNARPEGRKYALRNAEGAQQTARTNVKKVGAKIAEKATADFDSVMKKAKNLRLKWVAGLAAAGLAVGAAAAAIASKVDVKVDVKED